jgi:hypothetical protein
MANFQKHGKNVNGEILRAPGAKSYELGLWGPVDIRSNTELTVSTSPLNASVVLQSGKMLPGQPVRLWIVSNLPAGPTVLVAKDSGGAVWSQVTIDTAPASSAPGKKYTDAANEFPVQRTTPTAAQVVGMLQLSWPELTPNGARTLTAQFMAETGGGKYCFNWNLGNVKAGANDPHMYLANVWECDSQAGADGQVARAGGLARIATAEESAKHGWKCPNVVVVFSPPHAQCRFRAYSSLADGAQRWLSHHKTIAANNPDFLTAINAGDVAAVAHSLKMARYYTAAEADYARAMTRTKADIDKQLGPLPAPGIVPFADFH